MLILQSFSCCKSKLLVSRCSISPLLCVQLSIRSALALPCPSPSRPATKSGHLGMLRAAVIFHKMVQSALHHARLKRRSGANPLEAHTPRHLFCNPLPAQHRGLAFPHIPPATAARGATAGSSRSRAAVGAAPKVKVVRAKLARSKEVPARCLDSSSECHPRL